MGRIRIQLCIGHADCNEARHFAHQRMKFRDPKVWLCMSLVPGGLGQIQTAVGLEASQGVVPKVFNFPSTPAAFWPFGLSIARRQHTGSTRAK